MSNEQATQPASLGLAPDGPYVIGGNEYGHEETGFFRFPPHIRR